MNISKTSESDCSVGEMFIQKFSETCLKNTVENSFSPVLGNEDGELQRLKLDPAVKEARITFKFDRSVENASPPDINGVNIVDKYRQTWASYEGVQSMLSDQLESLTPRQFETLLNYTDSMRKRRNAFQKYLECAFCRNNGESVEWYTCHTLRDSQGRVRCPVLRRYRCPRCGATGDRAHTIKYCRMYDVDIEARYNLRQ